MSGGYRPETPREALEAITSPNLRSVAEIAYNNPARTCGCANVSVTGGGTCTSCGTYLHGPCCRPGCACTPEAWHPEVWR